MNMTQVYDKFLNTLSIEEMLELMNQKEASGMSEAAFMEAVVVGGIILH